MTDNVYGHCPRGRPIGVAAGAGWGRSHTAFCAGHQTPFLIILFPCLPRAANLWAGWATRQRLLLSQPHDATTPTAFWSQK